MCAVGLAPAAVRIAQFCPYSLVFVGEDTNRGRVGFRFGPGDGSAAPAAAATTRKQSLLAYAWSAVPLVFRVVSSRCLPPTREFVYVCMGGRNVCVLRLNPPSNTLLYLIGEAFHGGWIPPWAPHTQNFAYIKASGPSGPYLFHRTTGQNQKGPGRMCVRELGCKDVQRKKDAHVRACSCCCCCI